ncbi:hypothetical protein Agub_g13620, partial [Astrephomene gubernaculifera]
MLSLQRPNHIIRSNSSNHSLQQLLRLSRQGHALATLPSSSSRTASINRPGALSGGAGPRSQQPQQLPLNRVELECVVNSVRWLPATSPQQQVVVASVGGFGDQADVIEVHLSCIN